MTFFTPEIVAAVTGGRWLTRPARDAPLRGVGIDTRGDLDGKAFVAIRGERHDDHRHDRELGRSEHGGLGPRGPGV